MFDPDNGIEFAKIDVGGLPWLTFGIRARVIVNSGRRFSMAKEDIKLSFETRHLIPNVYEAESLVLNYLEDLCLSMPDQSQLTPATHHLYDHDNDNIAAEWIFVSDDTDLINDQDEDPIYLAYRRYTKTPRARRPHYLMRIKLKVDELIKKKVENLAPYYFPGGNFLSSPEFSATTSILSPSPSLLSDTISIPSPNDVLPPPLLSIRPSTPPFVILRSLLSSTDPKIIPII